MCYKNPINESHNMPDIVFHDASHTISSTCWLFKFRALVGKTESESRCLVINRIINHHVPAPCLVVFHFIMFKGIKNVQMSHQCLFYVS